MNTQHNEKGFTLIELIVVIAIMGIVAAVLIPQFATMTVRSRMSTDLSTVKTVQGLAEIYYQDLGTWPGGDTVSMGTNPESIVNSLTSNSYLDAKYLSTDSVLKFQTPSASIVNSGSHLILVVKAGDFNKFRSGDDKSTWLSSTN